MAWVSNFLKKGANSNTKVKKYMVKNIKCNNKICTLIESICEKDEKHAEIVKRKHLSLANNVNNATNQWTEEIVYKIIQNE